MIVEKERLMKNLLVAVEQSSALPSVLETAYLVARSFDAYIEGFYLLPAIDVLLGAEGMGAALSAAESVERETRQRADEAKQSFVDFVQGKQIPLSGPSQDGDRITAGWHLEEAPGEGPIGSRGRLFDLITVGRPIEGEPTPTVSMMETALFDSGRPVLLAPPTAPHELGNTVVIAWNGSTESARTVALAMPLLSRAESVRVLTIEGGTVPGPAPDELATMLERHGMTASAITVAPKPNQSVGEAILSESEALGADLLVKGAYTHSRLRQMIFGGATRHLIYNAELPVLMAN